MTIRIRLPGGTLKIKGIPNCAGASSGAKFPIWQVGGYFIVWWPSSLSDRPSKSERDGEQD